MRVAATCAFGAEVATESFADNANTERTEGYVVVNLLLGYTGLGVARADAQPFVGVSNVLDSRHAGSLVVNAFGGRYYEPSPGRSVQFGIAVSLSRTWSRGQLLRGRPHLRLA